ncbi:hypothetical protein AMJ49_01355 [Parcubacteria bacterium DG_74_2]|nr:MAG: hypothetical protein AMJ49_01355 [Parcubacteria bacterium DG_74_2]
MAINKIQKQKIIDNLKEKISKQKTTVFVDFSGVKTKDLTQLRKELKESSNELKIVKKSLAQIALKNTGFEVDLKGIKAQLALVFGFKDEISSAKIIHQFSEKNPDLKILGGIFENNFVEAEKVFELAKLPTKAELFTRLAWSIKAPVSNFVYVLQANIKGLIYALSAIKTQ